MHPQEEKIHIEKRVLFALLIATVLLTACVTTVTPAPTPTVPLAVQPAAGIEQIVVTWLVRSDEVENAWETQTVIPDFEAKNPGIKIRLVVATREDFDNQMQSLIEAGTPPDVWSLWGTSGFHDYLQQGLVADLTPFIENDRYDLSDFQEETLNIYNVDGKLMGMPISSTGTFVFYNKTQFARAGVDYPPTDWDDTTWTWEAFLEKCEELTKVTGDPRSDVYGCHLDAWPNDQYAWMWGQDFYPESAYQTGLADTAFLDQQAVIDAFQARQDLVWKQHYMPDPAQMATFGGADLFETQKVAMRITGGWGWSDYIDVEGFEWAAAALPYGAPGRKDVLFTDPWLLSSKSEHPEEAWTFLKYLASRDVSESFMDLSGAPPVRKSLAEKWYARFSGMEPDDVKQVHLGALKYGRETPSHMLINFGPLDQIIQSAVDTVIRNEKTAAESLPAANEKLIEALKKIQIALK